MNRRTRALSAALATVAALGLSACGAGFDAPTNEQYQPGVGANVRTGDLQVFNALLVANGDGTATVSAGLLNTTDLDATIESIAATTLSGEALDVIDAPTAATAEAGTLLTLGKAETTDVYLVDGAEAGDYVTLTLTSSVAEAVTVEVPVVERTDVYAQVAGGAAAAVKDDEEAPESLEEAAEESEEIVAEDEEPAAH